MANISFRNSRVAYYGPHECPNCGDMIVKAGTEWGGAVFTAPDTPIYPNTEWHPHICDPVRVKQVIRSQDEEYVKATYPQANAFPLKNHWVIMGEDVYARKTLWDMNVTQQVAGGEPPPYFPTNLLCISMNQTYYDTPEAAWAGVVERMTKGFPTWYIDLNEWTNPEAKFRAAIADGINSTNLFQSKESTFDPKPNIPTNQRSY